MQPLRFKQVDVFTRAPFRGNPVAVVLESGGLADADMQRIAAWTNLSETTFVLPATSGAAEYRLRIFTPRAELPFAGHPTIGSAHAVVEAGIVRLRDGRMKQECGAGVVELSVEEEGRIWLKSPPAALKDYPRERQGDLEKALGATVAEAPMIVNVGPKWIVADLGAARSVDGLLPDFAAIGRLTDAIGATGITVFGADPDGGAMHVRSFAPAHGIAEDPVCGSGNVSVGAYLARSGQLTRYGRQYQVRQGMQLGREGSVSVRVEGEAIFLGGHAVTCVEGTLRVN